MTEGKGSYLKTECGRTILDFTCGSASSLSPLTASASQAGRV